MKTVTEFAAAKSKKQKISMLTCYDYWTARILNNTPVDALLIGDSAAMVMHGAATPVVANIDMMAAHVQAVAKGAPEKFLVGDLPFLSYRKTLDNNMQAVERLMQAGAHAIKLEGAQGNLELIKHLHQSGVPVMGHIGLTPQSIHQLGGFKVQARSEAAAAQLKQDALALEEAGCFSIVLECVPSVVARQVSESLKVPTIGIGAGPDTDGQILVLQDMLGANSDFHPKFLRAFMNLEAEISNAVEAYVSEVANKSFPNIKESYE